MPSDDYAAAARGALKIRGVQGSKVEKSSRKKKKIKKSEGIPTSEHDSAEKKPSSPPTDHLGNKNEDDGEALPEPGANLTEAERQSYERRYKRLEEKLRKEGVKSHKERVENLNRYLSSLSEHHDMPRIGPG